MIIYNLVRTDHPRQTSHHILIILLIVLPILSPMELYEFIHVNKLDRSITYVFVIILQNHKILIMN